MDEHKPTSILDYFILLVREKKIFITIFFGVMLISYVGIYLFIEEEYESVTIIVPSEDKQLTGISSLFKNLGNLQLGGMKGSSVSAEMDLYITIVNSRTLLEDLIDVFNLKEIYSQPSTEKSIKMLRSNIHTKITDENAFEISIRANSPELSYKMLNYLLEKLNSTIIQLNILKSKNNRIFLEKRYLEVKTNLQLAEDSLQYYQQKSGMLEVQEQTKLIVNAYTKIESELLAKQIELSILENTYSKESPLIDNYKISIKEYEKKLNEMKNQKGNENIILALNTLPVKAKNYIRHYRDVEIYNAILEFLVPLYEQAKFEEQKDVPVLQIIDKPRIPEKKIYPPRIVFSLVITLIAIMITYIYVFDKEYSLFSNRSKLKTIIELLKQWEGK